MPLAVDFMEKLSNTRGDPSAFSMLVFGTPLHGGQRRYCANAIADVNFLLPGNSFGKTELIMRLALYYGWFKVGPDSPDNFEDWFAQEYKGLIASYNYAIALESFDRLEAAHRSREEVQVLVAKIEKTDPVRVTLNNGAQIDWGSLAHDGKLVEAARRRFIFVDEVGHIPDLSKTFDNVLFPRTMGVSGVIHLFGTPKAYSDPYLFEVYEKGKSGKDPFYYSQEGSVLENEFWPQREKDRILNNPRYVTGWRPCPDKDTCAELACSLREAEGWCHPILTPVGKQVILGAFILAGGLFFHRLHIVRIFTGEHDVKWDGDTHFHTGDWVLNDLGVWTRPSGPDRSRTCIGAFDLGGNKAKKGKRGSDATVGFVIDYTERPWKIVHFEYIEGGTADWNQKYEIMAEVYKGYSMPYLMIDATGQIDSVQEALQDRGIEVEPCNFGGTSSKKFNMLRSLQLAMELDFNGIRGVLRSPQLPRLKHELDHYVLPDDHIEQDCVMALAMPVDHIMSWEAPAALTGDVY